MSERDGSGVPDGSGGPDDSGGPDGSGVPDDSGVPDAPEGVPAADESMARALDLARSAIADAVATLSRADARTSST